MRNLKEPPEEPQAGVEPELRNLRNLLATCAYAHTREAGLAILVRQRMIYQVPQVPQVPQGSLKADHAEEPTPPRFPIGGARFLSTNHAKVPPTTKGVRPSFHGGRLWRLAKGYRQIDNKKTSEDLPPYPEGEFMLLR